VDGRNLDDALTESTLGNGVVAERQYHNVTGRLEEIHAGPLSSLVYAYSENGLVQSRADYATGRSEVFEYDSLNRLRFWQLDQGGTQRNTEYQYDVLGNLEHVLLDGQVTEDNQYGGFSAGPHAITLSSLHGELAYDARGRRTDGLGKHIAYTTFDLPREITTAGGVTTFAYDASGARVKKAGPSGTTIALGELYERRTDVQGETKHVFFVKSGEGTVAQRVYDQNTGTSETQYVLTDALGSVGVVTDTFGQEVERHVFEPFGKRINDDGSTFSGGVTDVRTGFTGQGHDDELGLIDMRGRVYDPFTRRFLTADPIVSLPLFGQSYNGYSYVLNSPVNLTDPSGYEPYWWGTPIPSAAMCGSVSGPYQASVHVSSSSGGFDSFGEAIVDVFETIGEGIATLFGGDASGATPTHKPAPYDPYAQGAGPTYADIENASLPSTTSARVGIYLEPIVDPRSAGDKVRMYLRERYAERQAEYDAYTEFVLKVGLVASCAPVLVYAGVGSALGIAGIELAGTGAAVAAAPVITTTSIGAYHVERGLATGDEGLIFEGVLTGLSGTAMLGDGLGAGPRAFAGGRSTFSRPLTAGDLGLADDAVVEGTFALRGSKATAYVQYLGKPPEGLGASLLGARNSLSAAARADGATTLRIETSPVIEKTTTLRKGLLRKGFAERPNGTMWWEGGL